MEELNVSGTVRIKPSLWDRLTKMSVQVTIKVARPINQSEILHYICESMFDEVSASEIAEVLERRFRNKMS